ncbi:response regulator transcription factor [Pseudacidovorax intermedius]|uniref:PhoB family transcriptional regulator n=1 Tax=Pseudacidovorax intermedius TaxID=433924 RepID=A0A147GM15_9BURK|nr:response regulator transcription factor [Pseudacidovorax intermedius]KTT14515.1 PhoB family transcriptional regulator [Pseudacidovorax intermedius]
MRILLVEDDRKAARVLARGLQEEGFVVDVVHSAEEADEEAFVNAYGLIVLDRMLPGLDGLSWCAGLRDRGVATPVLMLTARDALGDRVEGLNRGADDYLTKPFAFDELLARARALLRRSDLARPAVLTVGALRLDPVSHAVTRQGQPIELTQKEFALLHILMRHPGEVVSRARIAEQIWKDDLIAIDNLIDVHMGNLRRKLEGLADPTIVTVRGRGFRLAVGSA